MLVIHGSADSIIPCQYGRALFDALSEPKEWFEVKGGEHNDIPWVGGKEYLDRIDGFFEKHVERR